MRNFMEECILFSIAVTTGRIPDFFLLRSILTRSLSIHLVVDPTLP